MEHGVLQSQFCIYGEHCLLAETAVTIWSGSSVCSESPGQPCASVAEGTPPLTAAASPYDCNIKKDPDCY